MSNSSGVPRAVTAFQRTAHSGHRRLLRFGARRQPGARRARAVHVEGPRHASRGRSIRHRAQEIPQSRRMGAILRRGPRACTDADGVEHEPSIRQSPFRRDRARGAGGKTIGMNIPLPFEQGANPYITEGLHFEFHYFFMRKFWFAYLAKALVIFPGGFGTCDELFEILTLVQTDKLSKKIAVILYGRNYWDQVLNFGPMAEWGAIAEQDIELLQYADTPSAA